MPLSPAELEAGRICYDKSDIVEVTQLCILQDEKLVMETCLRFQEASTARPGRRTVRIVAAWCALIFLYFILNSVYSHILRWYGDFAFEWLSIRSPACIAPTWYDVRPSMDEDAEQPHAPGKIPQYVLDYAPYVHLYSGEQFWPCDIAEHLLHTTPELNYTPIDGEQQVPNLTNLDRLNQYEGGRNVFLTSKDDVEDRPDWLSGAKNIPANFTADLRDQSLFRSRHSTATNEDRIQNGRSDAPAVLITVNKGDGVVDAFWFFFYSYNLGNMVLNVRWGNHIGDWEHTLVRFQDGQPVAVFFSEHNFGSAYTYDAVEKIGKRPVIYSATGTHAMYATAGNQPYILPLGLLHDETDRGPLWDPALNTLTYTYDFPSDTLSASNRTPDAPTQWFYFAGHWGDKFYPLNDKRQYGFGGEYHYVNGPLGPRFKNLGRRKVCQGSYSDPCVIKDRLSENDIHESPGVGEGEDWPDDSDFTPPV